MTRKGFSSPVEVWQANLDTFLTVEMDSTQEWRKKVLDLAFEDDAMLFILHVTSRYMTFCRSKDQEREFFLTGNVYSLHEGLQSLLEGGSYTEYHTFAPIDPHLMIIFRSHVMRNILDSDEQEQNRQLTCRLIGLDPLGHSSPLDDLPVAMPQAQYMDRRHGIFHVTLETDTHPSGPRHDDKFTFKCFTIAHRHVEVINDVFFEQAYSQTLIAFRDTKGFAYAARAYLLRRRKGYKLIVKEIDKEREHFLHALSKFASRTLGSKIDPVYRTIDPLNIGAGVHMSVYVALHVVKELSVENRPDLVQIHQALGLG